MEVSEETQKPTKKAEEPPQDDFSSPPEIGFEDIHGLDDEKACVRRNIINTVESELAIDLLPTIHIGGKSGCGKTRFAKAIAGEIDYPGLSYRYVKISRNLQDDNRDVEEYLIQLLEEAREYAPSFVLIEEGLSVAKNLHVLEEHRDALKKLDEPVLTAFTTDQDNFRLVNTGSLDNSLYVHVGLPDKERWKEIFREELRDIFEQEQEEFNTEAMDNLSYDLIFEELGGYRSISDIKTLCRRIYACSEYSYSGRLTQECVEDVLKSVRQEIKNDPLLNSSLSDSDSNSDSETAFGVEETDTTYEDVGGLDDVIQEIEETTMLPNRYPELFGETNIGGTDGILLHGPPGNGKTLLARALANETDRTFLSVRGPELKNKWFGETEKLIRNLFEEAEENEPSIIFFDEFDSVAPSRENCTSCERGPVNMLLTEMDGLEDRGDILFLAATNRPEALDRAVLRPGRIGEKIEVPPPNREARKEVFDVYVSDMPVKDSVTLEWLAEETGGGVTGAEIESICRRAMRRTVRDYEDKKAKNGDTPTVGRSQFASAIREVTNQWVE